MFVKSEVMGSTLYYTSVKENYTLEYNKVKDFKPEGFVKSPLGKFTGLIDDEPLVRKEFDSISKFIGYNHNHKGTLYNNIDPAYQYIRHVKPQEPQDMKMRIWLFDIETDVMPNGSFPDPYKYEKLISGLKNKKVKGKTEEDRRDAMIEQYQEEMKEYVLPAVSLIQIDEFDTGKKYILGYKKETDVYKLFNNCIYKKFKNEKEMIRAFIALYNKRQVSILSAWNGNGFDYPYIVKRCKNIGVDYKKLSPYGKFKTEKYSKSKDDKFDLEKPVGVYWLDYMDVYKKLAYGGREKWSLDFIANYEGVDAKVDFKVEGFKSIKDLMYGVYNPEYDVEKTNGLYEAYLAKDEEKIAQLSYDIFVNYGIRDVVIMHDLESKLKYFETLQSLSQKMGCNLDDNLGTTTPWEIYVYNELYKENIALPPDKIDNENTIYHGGYIYADVGIWRWVMSEDVTSQYPSNLIAMNMSPETYINRKDIPKDLYEEIKELHDAEYPEDIIIEQWDVIKKNRVTQLLKKHDISMSINGACFRRDKIGIIPRLVQGVFDERKEFKKLMKGAEKGSDEHAYYDLRQYTAKILINSVYGAVGSKWFLLSNKDIAHAITSYGRYTIKVTGDYIISKTDEKFKQKDLLKRVYTHTDSFFLDMSKLVEFVEEKKGPLTRKQTADFLSNYDKKYIQGWIREISHETWDMFNGVKDCIFFDREKICHMILAGKAKYAVELIDNEGDYYPDQKVSITGLETKRSDTPALIRTILDKAIGIMFDNDNFKLINFIDEFRTKYYKGIDIDDIASPTGVSNISKHEAEKQRATPIHVRASMNYNKFILERGLDKDGYQPITDGEKVKWLRLKSNPYIKDDVFAYNDKSIFRDFDILKYMDTDTMYEKTFVKKVFALCETVNMRMDINSYLADELF